jgi:hypothetical protein
MQGTVRLEARTDQGKVKTTELITVRRPVMAGTLAEIGLTRRGQGASVQAAGAHAVRSGSGVRRPLPGLPGLRGAPAPQGPAHAQTADPVEVFNIPGRPLEPRDAPIAEPAWIEGAAVR